MTQNTDQIASHPGFNVIGYASGNLGLGVSARDFIELIRARGHPLAIFDLDPGLGRRHSVVIHPELTYEDPALLPNSINIFVLPPPGLAIVQKMYGPTLFSGERLNAALSFWELPVLSSESLLALNAMDVVIGCSESTRSAYEFALSGPFVVPGRQPLHLPAGIDGQRKRFHLPERAFLFVTSFEPNSDARRKNPTGVVEAFTRAFDSGSDAALVIRVNNATGDHSTHSVVGELRRAAAACPAIHLIEEPLSYVEVLSLYSCCNVFVSLHRAEGLGLAPLEAMLLGRPVIATAWSGNLTYMNHLNSCLVPYRLIPVDGTMRAYDQGTLGPTAYWADPDVDHAAAWMRKLVASPSLYEKLRTRALSDANSFNDSALEGKVLDELLVIWENRRFLPSSPRSAPAFPEVQAAFAAKDTRIKQLESQLEWIESRKLYRTLRSLGRLLRRH